MKLIGSVSVGGCRFGLLAMPAPTVYHSPRPGCGRFARRENQMKIVVLDGYTLNPGDLSWGGLEKLGECVIYDRTPAELTVDRARDAEIVLTNKVVLDCRNLAELPHLRYIGVLATGYDVVDAPAAAQRGIVVTNVPGYATASVAQMTFALLLELAMHVGRHAAGVREGRWAASKDFCYWEKPLVELEGLTMGLIGLGSIGREAARLASAFGMRVLACDPCPGSVPAPGVKMVSLDELLARSDVVSLHCPLTDQNAGLINADSLRRMKPTAFLINTARGGLVNEKDLADALNAGRIAGAAVDVLSTEPPPADNPLLRARNCLITPHIAWATRSARVRMLAVVVDNVRAFLAGRPANVVI